VTLSLTYALIYFLAKNFLLKFGLQNIKANDDRFRILSEAFNSIKEIKVNGVENVYCRYFDKPSKIYALSQSSTQLISNLPRYFLEAVVFGGMIIFLIILIKNKNDFMDIVPIVAIYIFAAYRLIPSLQQIYYSLTQISYAKPAINLLIKDLSRLKYIRQKSNDIPRMKFLKLLKFNKVYFAYSNSKKITLKNINISIKAFSKVGIIGQTGSGKSTIADLILGLISPLEGNIKIDANILTNKNIKSWQKNIGYVPQQVNLVDDTIAANIAFGVDKVDIDYRIIERCLKIANLYKFVIKELPNSYNTIVGERGIRLSGGQRQRIGIARALYHNPQVIILDEATNSLDSLTEEKVMSSIKNLGRNITIIIIAHRLSTLKDCDKLFLIDQGEVKAEGTYNELVSKNKKFKNYKH
jgi:ABC-type multidrug transport system fused ATPase/permease subunit